jgi:hypothetical protein
MASTGYAPQTLGPPRSAFRELRRAVRRYSIRGRASTSGARLCSHSCTRAHVCSRARPTGLLRRAGSRSPRGAPWEQQESANTPRSRRSDPSCERHHQQALHEGGAIRVLRDTRILVYVGYQERLAMFHHPARGARAQREPLALPERCDRLFIRVIAAVASAQNESHAIGAGQLTRGLPCQSASTTPDWVPGTAASPRHELLRRSVPPIV